MKGLRKYILLFLIIGKIGVGQNKVTDSLSSLLRVAPLDTNKVNLLNALAFELRSINPSKSIETSEEAIKLASKIGFEKGEGIAKINMAVTQINLGEYDLAIKNATTGLTIAKKFSDKYNEGRGYNTIGEANRYKDNYQEALKFYNIALKVRTETGDKKGVASVINNIAIVQFNLGNYPEALKLNFNALKIREEIGDLQAVAASYNNIALIYSKQRNHEDALKTHYQALEIRKKMNDKRGIATSYTNIANIKRLIGKTDEALSNYKMALKIFETLEDKKFIGGSYNNIGSVYQIDADTLFAQKNKVAGTKKIKEAIECFAIASKFYTEVGSTSGMILIAENMGHSYLSLGDYVKAKKYYEEGLTLALKIQSTEEVKNFYNYLSKVNNLSGDYKSAFENHKLFIFYRDSLDNEDTRKKTIQSQMTYDFEKKEAIAQAEHKKEMERQEMIATVKSRKQKLILIWVSCLLIMVVVFAGFVFRSLRMAKKQKNIIEEQKNVVEIQKIEVELQKHKVEEHQREIIDSIQYARRIQQSLLPTEKYIEKTFKRLMK